MLLYNHMKIFQMPQKTSFQFSAKVYPAFLFHFSIYPICYLNKAFNVTCLREKSNVFTRNIINSLSHFSCRTRWLSWMRRPTGDRSRRFNPRRGRQHSFVETGHEIFSTVILFLPLIQEGQLSVYGERMCTILVNPLED